MPLIQVLYDDTKITTAKMEKFCRAVKEVVADVTGINEVFVWGNSATIKIDVDPIEVIIEMSDHKVSDLEKLTSDISERVSAWKKENNFTTPATITVIPMHWKFILGV